MHLSTYSLSRAEWFVGLDETNQVLPALNWDSPLLFVSDVSRAIQFYQHSFGFLPVFILPDSNHAASFARMRYRGTYFTITSDTQGVTEDASELAAAPFYLFVDDVERVLESAQNSGARMLESPHIDGLGYRTARLVDIFGYIWDIADNA